MATERNLIEEAVIPFLEDVELPYEKDENAVLVNLMQKPRRYRVEVVAHVPIESLQIIYRDLAYAERQDLRLFVELNKLGRRSFGKWLAYPDGEVLYVLDLGLLQVELPSPVLKEIFKCFFDVALLNVHSLFDSLQRIVYAGMSVEEAIEYERRGTKNKGTKIDRQIDSIVRKAMKKKEGN